MTQHGSMDFLEEALAILCSVGSSLLVATSYPVSTSYPTYLPTSAYPGRQKGRFSLLSF